MKIGISTFSTDRTLGLVNLAKEVEERGFDCLFLTEHTHIPLKQSVQHPEADENGDLPEFYRRTIDPFVGLSFAAASTTTLELGTGICLLAQRDPITTAKEVASLDMLSGGRFVFGVGYGWNADELASHGGNFRTRRTVVRERVELWSEDVASYQGEYEKLDPSYAWPKPVQDPYPPVYLGGRGNKTMLEAAKWADVWYPTVDPEDPTMKHLFGRFWAAVDETGRDASTVGVAVAAAPPDPELLASYREQGARMATLSLNAADPDVMLHQLDDLTKVLISLR